MASLVQLLLEKGADPNAQTAKLANSQTPMHKAILNSHENILNLFVDFKGKNFFFHETIILHFYALYLMRIKYGNMQKFPHDFPPQKITKNVLKKCKNSPNP
jgi:ankyrin repeat protein